MDVKLTKVGAFANCMFVMTCVHLAGMGAKWNYAVNALHQTNPFAEVVQQDEETLKVVCAMDVLLAVCVFFVH